jgi:hypothetical protein
MFCGNALGVVSGPIKSLISTAAVAPTATMNLVLSLGRLHALEIHRVAPEPD